MPDSRYPDGLTFSWLLLHIGGSLCAYHDEFLWLCRFTSTSTESLRQDYRSAENCKPEK